MITLPQLAAEALGSFLAADLKSRFEVTRPFDRSHSFLNLSARLPVRVGLKAFSPAVAA
jgi:hypothetical protein